MLDFIPGLSVERTLPAEILTGLITGAYKTYGGVIRWAPGTEHAGQIVRHLIPLATASPLSAAAPFITAGTALLNGVNTFQLKSISSNVASLLVGIEENSRKLDALSSATQQILQVSNNLMAFSGLNLAVSTIGFSVLGSKFTAFEKKLNEIQKDIMDIRVLLALDERSRLAAVLRDLINIECIKNTDHRNSILLNSKNVLAPISLKYKELLSNSNSLEAAMAYEEYYCLTSIAHARCLAELGMIEMAKSDLEDVSNFWGIQARRITNNMLLGKKPERFLHSDFSHQVTVSMIAEWCDFAYGEDKGYEWIDQLRSKISKWYSLNDAPGLFDIFNVNQLNRKKNDQFKNVIPSIQKLVARSKVINGFIGEYEMLVKNNITPSEFQNIVSKIDVSLSIDGYLVLKPDQ